MDVLDAHVSAGGSVQVAGRVGVRPGTAKRHLADLQALSGLSTEQLICRGRAEGWLAVPTHEPPHVGYSVSSLRSAGANCFLSPAVNRNVGSMSSPASSPTISG